jgi:hypothetical protein
MKLSGKVHGLCLRGPLLATRNGRYVLVLPANALCWQVNALAATDGSVPGLISPPCRSL